MKKLFICDLGLNKQINDNFVELLTELRKKRVSVTYIDHHDIDSKVITKLKKIKRNSGENFKTSITHFWLFCNRMFPSYDSICKFK